MMVDDRQPELPAWQTPRALSLAVAALMVLALAAVVVGHEHQRRNDRRRVHDVLALAARVQAWEHRHGHLPARLAQLVGDGAGPLPVDPASHRGYGYRVLDHAHFRLCADFAGAGVAPARRVPPTADDGVVGRRWIPGPGHQCLLQAVR